MDEQLLVGTFESLAGFKGKGLLIRGVNGVDCPPGLTDVLPANGNRLFALLRNSTDASDQVPAECDVMFGRAAVREQSMLMRPGDIFLIDRDHPWVGAVSVSVDVAAPNATVDWYEASVV